MTLGDNQQPLTRRQARELARRAQEMAADEAPADEQAADRDAEHSEVVVADPSPAEPTPEEDDEAAFTTLSRRELRAMMAARAAAMQSTMAHPDAEAPAPYDDQEDDGIDDAVEPDAVEMVEIETDTSALPFERSVPVEEAVLFDGAQKLSPPVGHWSVPRDVDEDVTVSGQHRPIDELVSRDLSAGGMPTTTNALILPAIPQPASGSMPLDATGEVLITGSIDLPRSLGSTGQHPNTFDSSEMDHMLDQLDESAPESSVAPVSASKAVSSHASTRGVMTPPKSHAISVPTVLSVTGAVLAIGVLALFLGGTVFDIF